MEELEKLEKEIYGGKESEDWDDNKDESDDEEEEPVGVVYFRLCLTQLIENG